MVSAGVQVVPWRVGVALNTSCGGVLQFGIEVLVVVPSCALACAAEVHAVPKQSSVLCAALVLSVPEQSLVSARYLSVPLLHLQCAAEVRAVP